MPDKIKVGVVGLGVGSNAHIPGLQVEGFDVAAVAALHQEKVDAAKQQFGIEAGYTDFDQMLKHPGLDAVSIATQPSQHLDMVLKALDAGKHVMLEKPFALNTADATKMRDKARTSGKTAMIAENNRFAPSRAYVKQLIDSGYIGKVSTVSATLFLGPRERRDPAPPRQHWRSSNSTGGGFSAGPASTVFESIIDWVGNISAIGGRLYLAHPGQSQPDGTPADADEAMSATFELASGGWGNFTASLLTPYGPGARFDIFGSEGTLQIVQPGLLGSLADVVSGGRFDDGPEVKPLTIPPELFLEPKEGDPKPDFYRSYRSLFKAFANGIASGTSPSPSFEDAYQLQRLTDAIRESNANGGKFVTI